MSKKMMYVNRRAPHGTIYAHEALEVVLVGAAFDQDVSVVFLDKGREAEQAGVNVGDLVATIDGVAVMGLTHLNGLLMQTSGKVKVGFNIPEGEAHKIREVELPQP